MMRFSKPWRCSLEKGRLLGSAQTFRTAAEVMPGKADRHRVRRLARKTEHIKRAPLARDVLQAAHGVDETQRAGVVARIEIARHDRARPTADSREDRDILMSIRT